LEYAAPAENPSAEDESSPAGAVAPAEDAFLQTTVPQFEQQAVADIQARAGLWKLASAAYFAAEAAVGNAVARGGATPAGLEAADARPTAGPTALALGIMRAGDRALRLAEP